MGVTTVPPPSAASGYSENDQPVGENNETTPRTRDDWDAARVLVLCVYVGLIGRAPGATLTNPSLVCLVVLPGRSASTKPQACDSPQRGHPFGGAAAGPFVLARRAGCGRCVPCPPNPSGRLPSYVATSSQVIAATVSRVCWVGKCPQITERSRSAAAKVRVQLSQHRLPKYLRRVRLQTP